eukprot:1153107-Pelagomonas_calceolata.AAC.1
MVKLVGEGALQAQATVFQATPSIAMPPFPHSLLLLLAPPPPPAMASRGQKPSLPSWSCTNLSKRAMASGLLLSLFSVCTMATLKPGASNSTA